MKRLWICIALMAVICIASAGSLYVIRDGNRQLYSIARDVKYAYENGGDTSARLQELNDYWDKYYVRVSYVANTEHLNSISSGIFRLKYLLQNDSDEFLSELNSVCGQTEMLYQSQFPHLYSVL